MRLKVQSLPKKIIVPFLALSMWNCTASQATTAKQSKSAPTITKTDLTLTEEEALPQIKDVSFTPQNYDTKVPKGSTPLDTLFAQKSFVVTKIELAQKKELLLEQKAKGRYIIQFEAVADFDAAQKRRSVIEKKTGYGVYLTFDAPFYKLRGGSWTNRENAEDAAHRLLELGLGGYVIKL